MELEWGILFGKEEEAFQFIVADNEEEADKMVQGFKERGALSYF